ncbi:MAG: phosphatidylserine/phosphatidylglycerophosphate/cardiolipin synthase family protein [Candidatus Riflebacteria bacterium]|nr:phosphatidylserine/phosphatidylglycerophosphate/cardiolipin synthase family protein [Candidatus Riflebacteria bacterium]
MKKLLSALIVLFFIAGSLSALDFSTKPHGVCTKDFFRDVLSPNLLNIDEGYSACAAKVLIDKEEVFPVSLELMSKAKKSIFFQMYLFGGNLGDQIIDLLEKKMDEGVKVCLILSKTNKSLEEAEKRERKVFEKLHKLEEKGTPAVKPPYLQKVSRALASRIPVVILDTDLLKGGAPIKVDHSKLIIVDGIYAVTGGMNFADSVAANHDSMVMLAGPIVKTLERVFINNWMLGYARDCKSMEFYNHADAMVTMKARIADGWLESNGCVTLTTPYRYDTRDKLIKIIDGARESIELEMLIANEDDVLKALARAAKRGVKVRIILDPATFLYGFDWKGGVNNKAVGLFQKLKEQNPKIDAEVRFYAINPGQELHLKLIVVDNDIVGMGSTNFTDGAFASNYELYCFFKGPKLASKYLEVFNNDWQKRTKTAPKVNLARKIITIFADLIF